MSARVNPASVLLLTVFTVSLAAQQPTGQVRDPSGAAVKSTTAGSGAIAGRIVTGDVPDHPARHATITVSGSGLTTTRVAVSDIDGRYVVDGLPAGHYTVAVSKPAYVRTLAGPKPDGSALQPTVDVVNGQRAQADVVLPRGAVITGQVLDSKGKPRSGVQVRALTVRTRNGQRVVSVSAGTLVSSDDDGVYRIYGLPANDYVLSASTFSSASQSSNVGDDQVKWAQRLAAGGAGAAPAGALAPPAAGRARGDAPVYYPGAVDVEAAGIITVAAGEERNGADISLASVPLARIEGTVTGPVDLTNPGATQMSVVSAIQRPGILAPPIAPFVRPDRTGHFVVENLPPGRYLVAIRTAAAPGRGGAPPPPALWASTTVEVNGEDVTGLVLDLQRGLTLAGTVTLQGTTPAFDLTRLRVMMASTQATMSISPGAATAAADGTFVLSDVVAGPYRLMVTGLPPEWSVKSIDVGGTDVVDRGVEIAPGQNVAGVGITLTDRAASLSGSLLDRAGKGVPYTLLLFSTDRAFWTNTSRRTRQTRATADGAYSIKGLPPGEYYLVAIPDMTQIDLSDPTTFDELAASGYKLTLSEGEQKKQDMKIAGGGSDVTRD